MNILHYLLIWNNNASEVIVIVTLSLAKTLARVAVASFIPVLKVSVFFAPDEVAPVLTLMDEYSLKIFLS